MITFEPFFKTLEIKGISQYALIQNGFSTGTLDAIRKNHSLTLNTLNDICNRLHCDITDVIKYIPDND